MEPALSLKLVLKKAKIHNQTVKAPNFIKVATVGSMHESFRIVAVETLMKSPVICNTYHFALCLRALK